MLWSPSQWCYSFLQGQKELPEFTVVQHPTTVLQLTPAVQIQQVPTMELKLVVGPTTPAPAMELQLATPTAVLQPAPVTEYQLVPTVVPSLVTEVLPTPVLDPRCILTSLPIREQKDLQPSSGTEEIPEFILRENPTPTPADTSGCQLVHNAGALSVVAEGAMTSPATQTSLVGSVYSYLQHTAYLLSKDVSLLLPGSPLQSLLQWLGQYLLSRPCQSLPGGTCRSQPWGSC